MNTTASTPTLVRPVTLADAPALERFNQRLAEGKVADRIPHAPDTLRMLTAPAASFVHRRMLVAAQGGEIRAGMQLVHHRMWVNGEAQPCAWVQLPISEGMVNRAYSMAIIQVLRAALKETPWLLSLGVGSLEESWARMAVSLGWKHTSVPFYFHPVRVNRVMAELRVLRRKPWLRTGARVASAVGAGHLGSLAQWVRYRSASRGPAVTATILDRFGAESSEVFERSLAGYPATADRTAEVLNVVYPPCDPRFRRLLVKDRMSGETLGWVVCCLARMENNRHFGNLAVGVLVDGFGPVEHAARLLGAGCSHLMDAGAEILVANWSHPAWIAATRQLGFLVAPSQYLLFAPPAAAGVLLPARGTGPALHLTRGDSDGMVSFRQGAVAARAG